MRRRQSARGNISVVLVFVIVVILVLTGKTILDQLNEKDRRLEEARKKHQEEMIEKNKIISGLGQKLERSWQQDLVARLHVKSVDRADPERPKMRAIFVQYERGDESKPTLRSEFDLEGDSFHVDSWVINFERAQVENGDALRGKSLFMFRRAYGSKQAPDDGVPLYDPDWIPPSLKAGENPKYAEFEKALWRDFWAIASDPRASDGAGAASAYGSGVFMKAQAGQDYKITIGNNGQMSILPERDPALLSDP